MVSGINPKLSIDINKIENHTIGLSLIELSIVLMILSLFFSTFFITVNFVRKTEFSYQGVLSYQFLHLTRNKAIAYDRDLIIDVKPSSNSIHCENDVLLMPSYVRLNTSNRSKLGFTDSGTTKYSGHFSLHYSDLKQKLSLGIGLGQVYLR